MGKKIFEQLTRKQLRYILFRIKDAISMEQFHSRSNNRVPLRSVTLKENHEDELVFQDGELKALLEHWGYEVSQKDADGLVDHIKGHYSKQDHFSGFEKFGEPNGVFDAWDVGIDENDELTKRTRPEKSWLFGKSQEALVLRGLRQDRATSLEEDTGVRAAETSVTVTKEAVEREKEIEREAAEKEVAEMEERKRVAEEGTEIEVPVKEG